MRLDTFIAGVMAGIIFSDKGNQKILKTFIDKSGEMLRMYLKQRSDQNATKTDTTVPVETE